MNTFAFSGFLLGSTCLLLSILLIRRGTTRIHTTFALQNLAISVWGFGCGFAGMATQYDQALFWWGFAHTGAYFLVVFLLHHVLLINKMNQRFLLIFLYTLAITLPILFFSGLIGIKLKFVFDSFYIPESQGPLYPFYCLSWILVAAYATILLIRAYVVSGKAEKKTMLLYSVAYIFGLWGGATYVFLVLGVKIYPYGNFLIPIYCSLITYAILRHKLFDIEVIIKKTLVFAALFTIVFGIFVGIASLIQQFLGVSGTVLRFVISSLVVIITVRPLEIFLVRVTDKYLFQKKYDYKHLIKEFMDELKIMVLNMNGIAQSTVDFFMSSIRPASVAIFIYNKFTNKYDLIASSDFKDINYKIANDTHLIKTLGRTGKSIRIDSNEMVSSQDLGRLTAMGIELITPLMAHKELIGLLFLGKKKSDEDYTEDDVSTLSDLSGALSISLKNAQLFDERADAEKRALVGTIATGINHEIGNPLNIITIKLETFRILAREGMMNNKSKDEIMKEISNITQVCLDSVQRIAEITKQVAEFAKPDRKIALDKVNIGEAIDETIAVLKHGMIIDAGKIEKRLTHDPIYAVADKGQLKQILFNLIKNASHAIADGKGKIIVSVEKNNDEEVAIKVIDNGYGMPREVRDKVFTPFFTTKDPGKGTGLGLALVKIMVDRNDGRITVDSQEGQGTTFTLVFKGGLL